MPLTPSQQTVFSQFQEFVNSNDRIFIINGSAGTGKTTLLKSLLDSLDGNQWQSVLMAPTGRAAFILGQKTGKTAATIHRVIYQIEKGLKDDGSGQMVFSLRTNEASPTKAIYFIDEASMISDTFNESDLFRFGSGCLLQDLLTYCGSRKIVFIGDYAQLPPVGQKISPALDAEHLKSTYNLSCRQAVMKDVVRQSLDSGIYRNATFIRDAIDAQAFNEFRISDGPDVVKSVSLLEDYKKTIGGTIDGCSIVIAYSNSEVLDFNLAIRKHLHPSSQERLLPGDLLIVSQNNYSYKEELFNGTIVKVVECEADSMLDKRRVRFRTSNKDAYGNSIVKEMELAFRKVKIETPTHALVDCVILDSFLTDRTGALTKDYNQALMADFNSRMTKQGITHNSDAYRENVKTDSCLNVLVCKYGYAITCHKSQGGEWDNVFVDMDKMGGKSNSSYFRWAYTAITRSRKKIWHFATPTFSATSNIKVLPIGKTDKVIYYVPEGESFLDWHFNKISSLCATYNISCTEDRNKNYLHLLSFEKDDKRCVIQQWYGNNGYTSKRIKQSTNDEEFLSFVNTLIDSALVPDTIIFRPEKDFEKKLYNLVSDTASELGIPILNVIKEPWRIIFYLKTAPYTSAMTFSYNSKDVVSSVMPQSTGGESDTLLQLFCEKIH